jgi:hypothetical protein
MALGRDPQIGWETRLRHVASAGIELPPAIDQLRQRLKSFQRMTDANAMRERLAEAVIADDPEDDRELLWAVSLAEATANPPLVADLRDFVRLRVNRQIRSVYAESALPTYSAIAAKFDKAAQALTTAAALVNIEATAEAVVGGTDKTRKAWQDAATAAAELNRLTQSLKAAAVLASLCDDDADNDLPLCCDPGEAHRREVWHAWETPLREAQAERDARNNGPFTIGQPAAPSRTGRWGALLALGVTLRASPPDAFTPYRRPEPLIERTVHIDGRNVREVLDPEDPDYEPPEQQPKPFASPRIRVARR